MGRTGGAEVGKRKTGPSSQPGAESPCLVKGPILPLKLYNSQYFQVLPHISNKCVKSEICSVTENAPQVPRHYKGKLFALASKNLLLLEKQGFSD